jgi:hypothetical protein
VASKTGLSWTTDTLTINLKKAEGRAHAYLARTTEYYSLRSETFAKSKAPWTDRSGNARSGLTALPSARIAGDGGVYQIDTFHRVSYGIWLEVRFNQRYAIIGRTVQTQGPKFFETANEVLARMFGGS